MSQTELFIYSYTVLTGNCCLKLNRKTLPYTCFIFKISSLHSKPQ